MRFKKNTLSVIEAIRVDCDGTSSIFAFTDRLKEEEGEEETA